MQHDKSQDFNSWDSLKRQQKLKNALKRQTLECIGLLLVSKCLLKGLMAIIHNRKHNVVGANYVYPCYKSTDIECSLFQIFSYLCTCIVLFIAEGV